LQYATLGRTGLVVSRLSFGAMTFGRGPLVPGVVNDIDQGEADRMVARCLDAGVNFFDTADAYRDGESEIMLGRALGGARRLAAVIATKAGFRTGDALISAGLSRRRLIEACEASLKRLATDYIDVYFLHIPDPWTPVEETLRALEDLTRQGKIRYAGVSNFPAWRVAQMIGVQERLGWAPLSGAQLYYSLVGRDLEHDWVPFADSAGLGLVVWSPLAGGFLTGKYTRDNPAPAQTRRESFQIPPVDYEAGYPVVAALQEIAAAHDAEPGQVALAWTLSRRFVTSAIVGASRFDQLESNLGAIDLALSEEELGRLDAMTAPAPLYPGWMQPLGFDGKVAEALG
jgi:aryl-alcohol dehydrogenase-like predicted oxidoreductase